MKVNQIELLTGTASNPDGANIPTPVLPTKERKGRAIAVVEIDSHDMEQHGTMGLLACAEVGCCLMCRVIEDGTEVFHGDCYPDVGKGSSEQMRTIWLHAETGMYGP